MSKYLNLALGVIQSEHINSMQAATITEENIVICIKDQTYNTLYSNLKSKVHPRVWVKKIRQVQKLAISKKLTFFFYYPHETW